MEIGKPITEAQKDLFHRLLTTKDLIDISAQGTVSYSTVRNLYYRTQSITEGNLEAVIRMTELALEKSKSSITFFENAERQLEELISKEQ